MNEKTKHYIEVKKMLDEIKQEILDETLRCFKDGLKQGNRSMPVSEMGHKCGPIFEMIEKLEVLELDFARR